MAKILRGKPVADAIDKQTVKAIERFKLQSIEPTLCIMRIGDNPGDVAYERAVVKKGEKLGVNVIQRTWISNVTTGNLISAIDEINRDDGIHGVLLLRPLPKTIDEDAVRNRLFPRKDLDAITDLALAGVFTGRGINYPCTAAATMAMLDFYGVDVTGRNCLVMGRSLVIGRPVAMMLQKANGNVIMTHSKTSCDDLISLAKLSDIIVVATGNAGAFSKEMSRDGQIILDVGMNLDEEGNLIGDVDYDGVSSVVEAITPVPGGVGSVTTSVLYSQLVKNI